MMYKTDHAGLAGNTVFQVWRPGTEPSRHSPMLILVGSEGLQAFLEALAHGNTLFRDREFHITVSRDEEILGQGRYFLFFKRVGEIDTGSESIASFAPILQCRSTDGLMDDFIGKEWNTIVNRMREMDWEVTDPGPYPGGWPEDTDDDE